MRDEELHRKRNFVSAVLDTVGALVVVLDRAGRIVRFNRACERTTGYTFAEVRDQFFWDLFLIPEEMEPVKNVFEKLRDGDFPLDFENSWVAKDGQRRLIAWSNTALVARGGTVEHIICTGIDITERKHTEEALRQSNVELHTRNVELDAFAHMVAHDIKNPLHLMIGYAEALAENFAILPADSMAESMQIILKNARKIDSITDSLLLLSEVHGKNVAAQQLDMAAIVAEARQRVAHLIDDQTEIGLPDASAWPNACGYDLWVEQIWVNFLSNALKHAGRPLRIELGGEPQSNGMVRFWIRDNGIGIPPKEQLHLFMEFSQTMRTRGNGHGLGLSIVRRIVEQLGGEVDVQSSGVPGEGSIFSFTLPAA